MSGIGIARRGSVAAGGGASGVQYDAVGVGAFTGSATSLLWSHTATGANRCVLAGVTYAALGAVTASATYGGVGGVAMTSLGRRAWNNVGNNWTELFALLGPASGAHDVLISFSTSVAASGDSVSHVGVGSIGTAVLAHGSSTTPAVSVSSALGRRVVAVLGSNNSGLPGGKSGFTQTQRYNAGQVAASALLGDAAGAATVNFAATQGSGAWSAIGVDLIAA